MLRTIPAFLLLWPGPVAAAVLTTGSAPTVPWARLILSLLFCLALAGGAIALLRRYQRDGSVLRLPRMFGQAALSTPARLKILETRRASPHADLCLAELDGDTYFLALTAAGVTVLHSAGPLATQPPPGEGQ